MGSGIGSLDDAYDTAVAFEKGVSNFRRGSLHSLIGDVGLQKGFPSLCPPSLNQSCRWSCVNAVRLQGT